MAFINRFWQIFRSAALVLTVGLSPGAALAASGPSDYIYCIASDGHYVLYSNPFTTNRATVAIISDEWKKDLRWAKPHIDADPSGNYVVSQCLSYSADDTFAASKKEALDVDEIMRSTRSVRSFSTGWTF